MPLGARTAPAAGERREPPMKGKEKGKGERRGGKGELSLSRVITKTKLPSSRRLCLCPFPLPAAGPLSSRGRPAAVRRRAGGTVAPKDAGEGRRAHTGERGGEKFSGGYHFFFLHLRPCFPFRRPPLSPSLLFKRVRRGRVVVREGTSASRRRKERAATGGRTERVARRYRGRESFVRKKAKGKERGGIVEERRQSVCVCVMCVQIERERDTERKRRKGKTFQYNFFQSLSLPLSSLSLLSLFLAASQSLSLSPKRTNAPLSQSAAFALKTAQWKNRISPLLAPLSRSLHPSPSPQPLSLACC